MIPKKLLRSLQKWWDGGVWHKTITVIIAALLLILGSMYTIAEFYVHAQAGQPYEMGVSFIPDYASSLGVDPQANMDALLSIGVRHFRLVSYWSDMEPSPGQYDFSQLDWQFQKAEAAHAKIVLAVGLRQPRWPECHAPAWVDTSQSSDTWQPQLMHFMTEVVNRYKTSPALEKYQLENEYFLQGFGTCTNMSRQRLVAEYNLVKNLDPAHAIVVGRSNNAIGFPTGKPTPDEWSISIYKRVWDAGVTHRYLEYPFPSWYYAFLAGTQLLFWGRDMMIGELQAEPWPPHQQTIQDTSLNEQNKSFNAKRFQARVDYARGTGMHEIYLWGAEYWYYRLTVLHDASVWNVARQEFNRH